MAIWTANREVNGFGQFAVFAERPGKARANVTFFRGAPISITSYSYGDPFSDATAELLFPQITPFDDPDGPNMWFLNPWTNYDIYWVPVTAYKGSSQDINVINPIHGSKNLWMNMADKEIIWEGFSVSFEPTDQGMKVQLQGALYQLDRYLATPSYPPRPFVMERLMKKYFNPEKRPLRTQRLRYNFPDGWTKVYQIEERDRIYRPKGVDVGDKWTGMATRNTGNWERLLTGYIQELLSQMYTDDECGVASGDQWTIRKYSGRRPFLEVRERARPPDFNIWYGTPGVEVSLTRDAMSITNVIYGQGTGLDGVVWSRSVIANDGKYTGYEPIAVDPNVYPYDQGTIRDPTQMPAETLIKFSSGVSEADGIVASKKMLARDADPGWVGNITIKSDTAADIIRWKITAGMTVNLKGFAGNREGIPMHIAEVIHSPDQNTVSMRVDTRYRDLLTLEEVQARVRDPLTPMKMLQVNKRGLLIEDQLAPWDYSGGSGIIPRPAREFFHSLPNDTVFPWENWTKEHPPRTHEDFYIRCNANSNNPNKRWGSGLALMAQAGSIRSLEIMAVNRDGELCKVPFHVSIYYDEDVTYPQTDGDTTPFLPNHFQNMSPDGQIWSGNDQSFVPDSNAFVVGWGNYEERAGYSPNRSSDDGALPTGLLVDQSVWSWNMVENGRFDPYYYADQETRKKIHRKNMERESRSLWVHIWAEHSTDVFFIGRMYRLEPGV